MIFLIKGRLATGEGSFGHRLAVSLGLRPPQWEIDDEALDLWRSSQTGWVDEDPSAIRDLRYIDIDKVLATVIIAHREEFEAPPAWSPETSPQVFARWREKQASRVLSGEHLMDVFNQVCRMMESMDHPVLEGAVLGNLPMDTKFSQMITFKYSQTPTLKILLLPPDRGAARDAPGTAMVNGHKLSPDDLLTMISKDESGQIKLAPEILPAG